jgi:hypothetical protein
LVVRHRGTGGRSKRGGRHGGSLSVNVCDRRSLG